MNKLIIGLVGLLVVGAVAFVLTTNMGEARQVAQCDGKCGNPSCAAANGSECNCGASCCIDGACGGACGSTSCAAKTGKACNCAQ